MRARLKQLLLGFFLPKINKEDTAEFHFSIATNNVSRVKITALSFVILEIALVIAYFLSNQSDLWRDNLIYLEMYSAMLVMMLVFLFVFRKLGQDILGNLRKILITGSFFCLFILAWSAGIALLDQQINGQVIVYVFAMTAIAVVPIFPPLLLLFLYLLVHLPFLFLMSKLQPARGLFFSNSINSSAFLFIAWTIALTRFKKQEEDFRNHKLLQISSVELSRMNQELEEANQKLEILSQTDGLTGIYNRMMFEQKIKSEWNRCKRHAIPLSMLMIDLDFFKPYNDHYGHRAGDHCLQQIANVLVSQAKRSADFVARYGGEEFAVVLPHSEKAGALDLAEQIRQGIEDLGIIHEYSSISKFLTVSIGVYTVIPSDETDLETFIENADKALYRSKLTRNTVSE